MCSSEVFRTRNRSTGRSTVVVMVQPLNFDRYLRPHEPRHPQDIAVKTELRVFLENIIDITDDLWTSAPTASDEDRR